ncbi:restriction endonuclease subunit S [Methanobrevibacter millerae]|uniref:Type I restriction modification DNA specificity domain-containing protein n=1 Tax=Methanobrevibacter millerae TaxID=230361 RepID=A0A1G5WFS2_9EURY|nr:restriction endonuclease subunit S [Methanobrevibacter millerae]SDA56981.1 Type I restriction modification DNA specificity domain-containing protein [Methanobrevibacter millerae]
MIRNETHSFFHFIDENDNRLDYDYYHPIFEELDELVNTEYFDVLEFRELISNIVSGKTPKNKEYIENGVMFLGAGNISEYGLNLDNVDRIDYSLHESTLSSSQLKEGDILITMAGTIGNATIFNQNLDANINQAVAKVEINSELINKEYLVKYLNSKWGKLNFRKFQHEVSQPNINLEEIKKLKIIVPPLDEQIKLVNMFQEFEKKAEEYRKLEKQCWKESFNIFESNLSK